jgi:hypothetical protein
MTNNTNSFATRRFTPSYTETPPGTLPHLRLWTTGHNQIQGGTPNENHH